MNILNFALFRAQEEEQRAQWRFGMVTYHQPQRALDVQLELNFLELPKLKHLEQYSDALLTASSSDEVLGT